MSKLEYGHEDGLLVLKSSPSVTHCRPPGNAGNKQTTELKNGSSGPGDRLSGHKK